MAMTSNDMSSTEERNGTKFIWKIENFSIMKEEMLDSPTFSSHSVKFHVKIRTSTLKDTEVINIGIHQYSYSNQPLSCSLAILNSDGFPLIWKEKKNFTFGPTSLHLAPRGFTPPLGRGASSLPTRPAIDVCTFYNFIGKKLMFGSRKNKFLPNNTLTVQCLIWHTPEELVLPLKCFARTRIEPIAVAAKKTFIWIIENVSAFTEPRTQIEEIGRNFAFLTIQLSFDTEDKLLISFKPSLLRVHLKMKISVVNAIGENIEFLNKEMKDHQVLQTNITKTLLNFHKNLFLNQDTLS